MGAVSKYGMTREMFLEEWEEILKDSSYPILYFGFDKLADLLGISIHSLKYYLRINNFTKEKEYDKLFEDYPVDIYTPQDIAKIVNKSPKMIRIQIHKRPYVKRAYKRFKSDSGTPKKRIKENKNNNHGNRVKLLYEEFINKGYIYRHNIIKLGISYSQIPQYLYKMRHSKGLNIKRIQLANDYKYVLED